MLGKPKYKKGDTLLFRLGNKFHKGSVFVVDEWGTFGQNLQVSYDLQSEENILYKHIRESQIIDKIS